MYVYIKAIRHVLSIERNNAIMGSFGNMLFILGLVDFSVVVIAVEPHSKIKGLDNVSGCKHKAFLNSVQNIVSMYLVFLK